MSKETVVMAHGSGGKLSQDLFQDLFQPHFSNQYLDAVHDGAIVSILGSRFWSIDEVEGVEDGLVEEVSGIVSEPLGGGGFGSWAAVGFGIESVSEITSVAAIRIDGTSLRIVISFQPLTNQTILETE